MTDRPEGLSANMPNEMGDVPFTGFMPFSKLLDYLIGEFDRYGDCWVVIDGRIRTRDYHTEGD